MLREDKRFYLPNLYTFQNENTFYGSYQGLRFCIKPAVSGEGDDAKKIFACCVWYGEYCMEESELAAQAEFSLDESGYEQTIDWLETQYQRMPETVVRLQT